MERPSIPRPVSAGCGVKLFTLNILRSTKGYIHNGKLNYLFRFNNAFNIREKRRGSTRFDNGRSDPFYRLAWSAPHLFPKNDFKAFISSASPRFDSCDKGRYSSGIRAPLPTRRRHTAYIATAHSGATKRQPKRRFPPIVRTPRLKVSLEPDTLLRLLLILPIFGNRSSPESRPAKTLPRRDDRTC